MMPDYLKIKEYDQAIKLLDDIRAEVEAGNVMSVTIACETTGGELYGGCTATQNRFAVAGYMLAWAMERLGFANTDVFQKRLGEKDERS